MRGLTASLDYCNLSFKLICSEHLQLSLTYCLLIVQDLLELMRAILGVRLSQLTLVRGDSVRHKQLLVTDATPERCFDRLRAALVG